MQVCWNTSILLFCSKELRYERCFWSKQTQASRKTHLNAVRTYVENKNVDEIIGIDAFLLHYPFFGNLLGGDDCRKWQISKSWFLRRTLFTRGSNNQRALLSFCVCSTQRSVPGSEVQHRRTTVSSTGQMVPLQRHFIPLKWKLAYLRGRGM